MRRLLTAALGLGLLALAGCSGDADPAPAPASPSSTTASPSPSPSPTAPVMPEAARAHTEAGAKAFVEYFWEVVNYAQATGDTDAIRQIVDPSCKSCQSGIASIRKPYDKGGVIKGGESTTRDYRATLSAVGGTDHATVEYEISVAPMTFDYPGDVDDASLPSTGGHRRARLRAEPGVAWRVVSLEDAS